MKLYKVLYVIHSLEDTIYFSANNLTEVMNTLDKGKEVHSITYLGKIEILN